MHYIPVFPKGDDLNSYLPPVVSLTQTSPEVSLISVCVRVGLSISHAYCTLKTALGSLRRVTKILVVLSRVVYYGIYIRA